MPGGRPSLKTPELVEELLSRLVLCDSGLEGVCKADDMPGLRTVFRWINDDAEFRQEYMRAREMAGEVQACRAMQAAINADDPQKARLEYDARKWAAGKLHGKWYGDKLIHAGDDEAPVRLAVDYENMPAEALRVLASIPLKETNQ
jgi:hypothetical protein